MATSGTVATYVFDQRKVIDHAARRAGYEPQRLTAEDVVVAQDLLFLQLSEYVNAGFPLWTRQYVLLGAQIGSPDVPCPAGTVDVIHSYWRSFNPYRGPATITGGGDGSILFNGQPGAGLSIPGPNPGVTVSFGTPTQTDTVGILLGGNAPLTAALEVGSSPDGVTYTTQTLPSATFAPGTWSYFDLNPTLTNNFLRITVPITGALPVLQFNLGLDNGQDVEIGPLNIDDYYNLPNKVFQSDRANSAYVDRQVAAPVIKIWPTLNVNGFYNGTPTALLRRYIQDPGSMTDTLEMPIRWFQGVVARLGVMLMDELPDQDPNAQASYFSLMAKQQRRTNLDATATKAEALMWAEERTRAPIRVMPQIGPYTR